MLKRLVAVLALLAGSLVAASGPATAIVNGQPDDGQHPYVGIVFTDTYFCSGTAISPTVVVMAAHCLEGDNRFWVSFAEHPALGPDGWPDPSGVGVVTGTGHPASDYCLPPGSCHPGVPGFTDQSDVAVVVLDTPVDLERYASLPDAGLVGTLPDRQPVTVLGYGVTEILRGGGRPVLAGDPVRERFTGELLQSSFRGSERYLRLRATRSHAQICPGDSGGPVLLGDTLIGVNSFIYNQNCSGPGAAARVDLAPVLAAIRSYL